jgi:superfamily II DNA or RNA helicase
VAHIELDDVGAHIRAVAGTAIVLEGLRFVAAGAVSDVGRSSDGHVVGRVGDGGGTAIVFDAGVRDDPADVDGMCTCGRPDLCGHVVAVLLVAGALARGAGPLTRAATTSTGSTAAPTPAPWATALGALLAAGTDGPGPLAPGRPAATAAPAPAGLQLELRPADGRVAAKLLAQPVIRSWNGSWTRSGTTWGTVGYRRAGDDALAGRQRALLAEVLALTTGDPRYAYGAGPVDLAAVPSRRVWDLLCEIRDAGVPLVQAGRRGGDVVLHDAVTASLLVRAADDGLRVSCSVVSGDGTPVPRPEAEPLGAPPRALVWWQPVPRDAGRPTAVMHLAPVPVELASRLAPLDRLGELLVPHVDAERLVRDYLPRVGPGVTVRTYGDVPAVAPDPPRLHVTLVPGPDAGLDVQWGWADAAGPAADPVAAANSVATVIPTLARMPELVPPGQGRGQHGLPPDVSLRGMAAVRMFTEVVPRLEARADLEVSVLGERPRFRAAQTAPQVRFEAAAQTDRDWFDLAVTVVVDDEQVPFPLLFTALARGDSHVVLPGGVYFPLDDERFAELAALIEESRALNDGPEHGLRLSRYQADAWAELERLGVVAGQAREWLDAVSRVTAAPTLVDHEPPAGIVATLRPYQRAGFGWLATLYDNGLGGVLADDMGLGKTVQTLALMCHVRERERSAAPFLVVAPTSVVTNWKTEAAAFAPTLRVTTVGETAARRGGTKVGDLAAHADVVVTSYALFRIEHDQYAGVEWAGLVLDEAQMIKNHTSRGYQCARTLAAPFKLAITGTPLENNLMELWSLLSVVAPGLLSNPARFTEYFRAPVERDRDGDRLALLRRRISPLMLRRTKEQVAPELPPKQEQVLEIELAPRHRKAYQTYLQRERRKVLGLVDDLQRNRFEILKSLTLLRQAALDVGLVDPARTGVPATKLDVLADLVDDIVAEGHRVLVFSQFTRFLTAARDRLTANGVTTCYLDGRTRRRAEVIDRFRTGDDPVFLISLKAGGTGLTLTEADYCILLDPWWNPATENQAVDRTHRIGQTRNVMVYRLVAKDTIEEKVMALKAVKAELFSSVLDGGDFASASLTASDIRRLVE